MRAILTYHSIDDSGSPISVAPEAFARHVAWFASGRVAVEPLASLAQGHDTSPDGRDRVALTFDDGFVNVGTSAWPRLRDAGLPATIFVVSGHVGRTNRWGDRPAPGIPELPLLPWAGLASCAEEGAEIGAHSRTHPRLTTLTPTETTAELDGCRRDLAARLGVTATSFAYPYGDVSDAITGLAAQVFALACTTEHRAVARNELAYRLPRLDMFYFQHPHALDDWGRPAFLRRIAVRRALRTVRRWWPTGRSASVLTPTAHGR